MQEKRVSDSSRNPREVSFFGFFHSKFVFGQVKFKQKIAEFQTKYIANFSIILRFYGYFHETLLRKKFRQNGKISFQFCLTLVSLSPGSFKVSPAASVQIIRTLGDLNVNLISLLVE